MRKSSRLWWLHGAILLSAVIGCKNCGSSSNSCGGPGMSGSPYSGAPVAGPVGSAGGTLYSQGANQAFPSSTSYPSAASSMSNSAAFPSSANAGYMPGLSSSMPQGLGNTR